MSGLPGGLVTFAFTDIEGSTRLHQRLGADYVALLARHDELLTAVVEGAGGHVVTRMGDGLFVVFPDTTAAVLACLAAQEALAAEAWPGGAEVRVRMGVHCGVAEPTAEGYVALAVHQAARVSAAAHGGQVLLTRACVEQLDPALGLHLRNLGSYRLKDFDLAEVLWQVAAAGADPTFPALRVPPVSGHNLRIGRTSFVGRDKEIRQIQEALAEHRLVTVLGPGGVGKSRLAARVAAETVAEFADGVRAVGLVAATDADSVVVALAEVLGVNPGATPAAAVIESLVERELLLLVDNCEHVLPAAAALVDDILEACPGVRVLATSREPLRVEGEHQRRIGPLAVPPPGTDGAELLTYDSMRLFLQRAAATHGDFTTSPEQLLDAATICRLLDGLPLALELAAARVGRQPLADLARQLAEGTSLGDERSRTAVPHHRTLHTVVEWSVRLLDEHQRRALTALAWLPAGFELAAAGEVLTTAGVPGDPVDLVGDLLDRSLLHRGADDRYTMLEVIRQHCHSAAEPHEVATIRGAVLTWAVRAGRDADADYDDGDLDAWNAAVHAEHDTWVDALQWAAQQGPVDDAVELAHHLHHHFYAHGHFQEGLNVLRPLVRRLAPDHPGRAGVLCELGSLDYLNSVGNDVTSTADLAEAEAVLEEALTLVRQAGDDRGLSRALNGLASVRNALGQPKESDRLFRESLAVAHRLGDELTIARAEINLGGNAQALRDFAAVIEHNTSAVRRLEPLRQWSAVSVAELNIGEGHLGLDQQAQALVHLERAAELATTTGDPSVLTYAAGHLARLARDAGDPARAREHAARALEAARELGKRALISEAQTQLDALG